MPRQPTIYDNFLNTYVWLDCNHNKKFFPDLQVCPDSILHLDMVHTFCTKRLLKFHPSPYNIPNLISKISIFPGWKYCHMQFSHITNDTLYKGTFIWGVLIILRLVSKTCLDGCLLQMKHFCFYIKNDQGIEPVTRGASFTSILLKTVMYKHPQLGWKIHCSAKVLVIYFYVVQKHFISLTNNDLLIFFLKIGVYSTASWWRK